MTTMTCLIRMGPITIKSTHTHARTPARTHASSTSYLVQVNHVLDGQIDIDIFQKLPNDITPRQSQVLNENYFRLVGSGVGGSMSFEFLHDWFHLLECLVGYHDDFMDLEEQWSSYRHKAFLVAFFGTVLFPSPSGAISFSIRPLESVLPHGFSFIPALLSETIRSLSLYREIGRGRLGCCVHMLQLWFYSHLSVIVRD